MSLYAEIRPLRYQLGEHGMWDKHSNFHVATNAPLMIRARITGETLVGWDMVISGACVG